MRHSRSLVPVFLAFVTWSMAAMAAPAGEAPPAPWIDSVVPSPRQPHPSDPAVIWHDDFDGPEKPYTESEGGLDDHVFFGDRGRSMLCLYEKGSRGVGNRKVFFGDSPTGKVVRRGESFDDIYWRVYVRHQEGWTGGGPAKLSRATSMVSPRWNQAMISHVWSSGEALTLDPASGVRGDRIVTTKYNDFPNLHWLGNKPASQTRISSTDESGRWVCVEARAKLNTPGKKDGLNQLWIDGRLETQRTDLDWRGGYAGHGINAVFLESYWNEGSPVTQRRWLDNFVISTRPIGPVVCPRNPVLLRAAYRGPGKLAAWEVEAAADPAGQQVVWKSHRIAAADRVVVSNETGRFLGPLSDESGLVGGKMYYFRVRQENDRGQASAWSTWHQAIQIEPRQGTS